MASIPFNAQVRQQAGLVVIDLMGEINIFAESQLNRAYSEAENSDPKTIALNFAQVDYINSSGIALIVSVLSKARQAQRRLVVYGLSDHYTEIFQITRLADFMTIFPDEVSALAAV